ncbi:MAG: MFS transporter [Sulfobacillus thermotolerans]|nr:MFS transporter [Sulfobacillus thermotolerans]
MAETTFHLANAMLILSFIATFGLSKAVVNLFAGHWSDRVGRKKVLMWGWIIGLPVPVLLAIAPNWNWVIGANVLLGINQGLAWTMTSVGKIDLVGPRGRGLAVGIDEGAGYLGLAVSGWATALLAAKFGLRPVPFVLAEAVALLGLLSTITLLRETRAFALLEHTQSFQPKTTSPLDLKDAFAETTWKNRGLSILSLDGQINKWSDTLMWGIVPLYLTSQHVSLPQIGLVAGVYAGIWGLAQFGTGLLSDHIGRRRPILLGLSVDAVGVLGLYFFHHVELWVFSAGLGGLGTALLYPNLSSAVSDIAPPAHRGGITGVFRLWRDGGYAVAAILLGAISAASSLRMAILVVGILLLLATFLSWWRLPETLPRLVDNKQENFG